MNMSGDARVFVAGILLLLGGLLVSLTQNFDLVLAHATVIPLLALMLLIACVGVFWSIKTMKRSSRITFVGVVIVLCILPLLVHILQLAW